MTPMIYQVSFSVENVGKNQADSKKRVQWVYQIINNNNNNNNNGAAAPEQHTIEFTWSLRSGKQDVTLDGQTVLFSKKKGRSVFDEVLTQGDSEGQQQPHLQLVCAQKPPLQAHPDFRCFELLIDQKPFGTYPQLHTNSNTQPVVVVEPTEFTSTLAPGEDIMTVATPFYDGPMSILDILFPGKYSHAPITGQQLEMEPAMAFGGGGDENNTALTVSETPTVSPYALTTTPPEHQQAQPMVDLLA